MSIPAGFERATELVGQLDFITNPTPPANGSGSLHVTFPDPFGSQSTESTNITPEEIDAAMRVAINALCDYFNGLGTVVGTATPYGQISYNDASAGAAF